MKSLKRRIIVCIFIFSTTIILKRCFNISYRDIVSYKDIEKVECEVKMIDDEENCYCLFVNNDVNFYYYGDNSDIIGYIEKKDKDKELTIEYHEDFLALRYYGEKAYYHCTTDKNIKPYDKGYFMFGASGNNEAIYYKIINNYSIDDISKMIKYFEEKVIE